MTKERFVQYAIESGFTKEQAEFMWEMYVSQIQALRRKVDASGGCAE